MRGGLPNLNIFYFDRVWLKAYPRFFSNLRIKEYMDIYREYRDNGVFNYMSDTAFTLYRTLDCIRRAVKHGSDLNMLSVDKCRVIRRYGEQEYYDFIINNDLVEVVSNTGIIDFTLEQVKSVRFISYTTIVRDRLHYEKSIYIEYKPWLKVMIKPYLEGFIPPMIRVFYNPLIRSKEELGIRIEGYEYQYDNFIDPSQVDTNESVSYTHLTLPTTERV